MLMKIFSSAVGTAKGRGHQFFFFKSGQIYMKDEDSAESIEKSNFRFFRYSFFEVWSFFSKSCQFSIHFHDNSKNKNRKIYFASYRENSSKIGVIREPKLPKMPKTRKIKLEKSEIWFFYRFSRFQIFHVNLITFDEKIGFFFSWGTSPLKKWSNLTKCGHIYMKDAESAESKEK